MVSWTNSMKEDPDYKPLILKNGLVMLYDHVMMNGGRFVHNEGSWGNEEIHKRRITCDDMQNLCIHGDKNCRITDIGKKIVTVDMPDEKPFFFCAYHAMEHALVERFTQQGYRVQNPMTDFAHP